MCPKSIYLNISFWTDPFSSCCGAFGDSAQPSSAEAVCPVVTDCNFLEYLFSSDSMKTGRTPSTEEDCVISSKALQKRLARLFCKKGKKLNFRGQSVFCVRVRMLFLYCLYL